MLFNKKSRFMISERQIKEELKNDSGEILVKLNLRFPELKCPKNDPLLKNASPFYDKLAEGFAKYARTDLLRSAAEAKTALQDNFVPFSAVMFWEKTYEDDKYLSFIIDISLSNGNAPITERQTQTWDRKRGTLCKACDFLDKKKIKEALSPKKHADNGLFVLREGGIEFHVRENDMYSKIFLPTEETVTI